MGDAATRQTESQSRPRGYFDLRTVEDVHKKLRADYATVQADPTDVYAAFNFVTTAWHLLAWLIPEGDPSWRDKRGALRRVRPILDVCRDLASGVSHFGPKEEHDLADAGRRRGGQSPKRSVTDGAWTPSAWAADLVVHLEGPAARVHGVRLEFPVFVDLVMEAWEWILAGT